ncbi:MAG: hypothetical protein HRU09_07810 [Oligoflexales bacterium]|nr:hypothetical protein [Oligoflexales bacterium]
MLVKLLMVLGLAAGMIQCKTSKVKSPQRPSAISADAEGQTFDMPKFLLTQNADKAADLRVKQGSLTVAPFVFEVPSQENANLILVNFAPEKPAEAHYGVVKLCFNLDKDKEQCFPEVYTPLFSAEFAPPRTYNNQVVTGSMSVQVRVCNASDQQNSGCGDWSARETFSLGAPNPLVDKSEPMKLLQDRADVKAKLAAFVETHLAAPAASFKTAFETKYRYSPSDKASSTNNYRNASPEEQMLYTTAHNIVEAPWAMAAIYSTDILESLADRAEVPTQGAGLALTETSEGSKNHGSKTDITNSLNCDAAGYVWVNEDRACYLPKQEESNYSEVKIHKRWTNGKAIAGEILLFGAIAGGGSWAIHNYIQQRNQKISGYDDVIKEVRNPSRGLTETRQLEIIDQYSNFIKGGGRFRQVGGDGRLQLFNKNNVAFEIPDAKGKTSPINFGGPGSKVYPITAPKAAKISTIGAAAIIGTILFIDGAAGYGLTSPSTYQEHFRAFKASLSENAKKLAELKNSQCDIEKQLFGSSCN